MDLPIEKKDEYDDEVGMAKNQLQTIQRVAKHLQELLKDGENLPEWVQAKLTLAQDYTVKALDYMASKHERGMVHDESMGPQGDVGGAHGEETTSVISGRQENEPPYQKESKETTMKDLSVESLKYLAGVKEVIAECGMAPSGPTTPAQINITAASGPELTGMLKDLMSLAGVQKVGPEHMPLAASPGPSTVVSAPPMQSAGPSLKDMIAMVDEPSEKSPDSMNDEEMEEAREEDRPYDSSPHEEEKQDGVRQFGDINNNFQNALVGKEKETTEESLMSDYKKFVSEAKKDQCCCKEKGKDKCPVHSKKKVKESEINDVMEKDMSSGPAGAYMRGKTAPIPFGSQNKPGIGEDTENLSIGQQMARDGVTYSREREGELIKLMGEYMKKAGMNPKAIRYYLSYDEDFIPDNLSELPREDEVGEEFDSDPIKPEPGKIYLYSDYGHGILQGPFKNYDEARTYWHNNLSGRQQDEYFVAQYDGKDFKPVNDDVAEGKKWVADAVKGIKKGALRKQEHKKKGEKFSKSELKGLAAHGTAKEKKRAQFALNISKK